MLVEKRNPKGKGGTISFTTDCKAALCYYTESGLEFGLFIRFTDVEIQVLFITPNNI